MFTALIKAMRPKQWLKNGLIFAALVFDRQLTNTTAFLHTLAGLGIFCLLASTIYIINDLSDLEADRQHPKKRHRPIASGQLPIPMARAAAILFPLIALPASYSLSPAFTVVALVYLFLNLGYSNWLKHIHIIDVLILASFYVLRVVAGVSLIQVERFSPWLYVVTTLGALYVGLGKRRAELLLLAEGAKNHRRALDGYSIPLLDQLITIVSGTTIVTYSLYTFFAPNLPENHAMMLTIPFVLYGIFRYLYLIQHGQGGTPEDIIIADRPLQVTVLLWGLAVLLIFYIF